MIARTTRVPGRSSGGFVVLLMAVAFAGCGDSSQPKDIAPEARKALDRRKVDAQPRAPKGSKASTPSRR